MENKHERSEGLSQLDRLAGEWELSGDTTGTTSYEWMEGGFFLVQKLDMQLFGRRVRVTEIIGHLKPFGQQASTDIHSRAYDADGNTFDYVYEPDGDALTVWGGEKGSPAFFRCVFSADGNEATGEWTYPGGGYKSNMRRVQEPGKPGAW